jgi:hypothetical protein
MPESQVTDYNATIFNGGADGREGALGAGVESLLPDPRRGWLMEVEVRILVGAEPYFRCAVAVVDVCEVVISYQCERV